MTDRRPPEPPPLQIVKRGLLESWAIAPLMILIGAAAALFLVGVCLA